MCDDLEAEMARIEKTGVMCAVATEQSWGMLTHINLPGGGRLGLYQPKHERP